MSCCSIKGPVFVAGILAAAAAGHFGPKLLCCSSCSKDVTAGDSVLLPVAFQDAKAGAKVEPPSQEEMAKAWMEFGAINDNHKMIAKMAGTWDAHCKFWMGSETPTESTGVMTNTAVLGGRWIHESFKGKSDEFGEFEGIGYFGYDNGTKKFTSLWMDTMSTGAMMLTGDYDAKTRTFTTKGTCTGPDGGPMTQRHTAQWVDDNTHIFTMYDVGPDGNETKSGEITYKRRAAN